MILAGMLVHPTDVGDGMDEDREDRLQVIHELFVLMTALSENAAEVALSGQGGIDPAEFIRLAGRMREAGHRIAVLASAVGYIPLR